MKKSNYEIKINDTMIIKYHEYKFKYDEVLIKETVSFESRLIHLSLCLPWLPQKKIEQWRLWLKKIDRWYKYFKKTKKESYEYNS